MTLHEPILITPRLLPGLRVGGAFISLDEGLSMVRSGGRVVFRYFIDLPDGYSFEASDLRSGAFDAPTGKLFQEALGALLAFLESAGESYAFRMRLGRLSPGGLFPPLIAEWAYQNSEEIGLLRLRLAEPGLIQEDAA